MTFRLSIARVNSSSFQRGLNVKSALFKNPLSKCLSKMGCVAHRIGLGRARCATELSTGTSTEVSEFKRGISPHHVSLFPFVELCSALFASVVFASAHQSLSPLNMSLDLPQLPKMTYELQVIPFKCQKIGRRAPVKMKRV
jgi:hypothetical protein